MRSSGRSGSGSPSGLPPANPPSAIVQHTDNTKVETFIKKWSKLPQSLNTSTSTPSDLLDPHAFISRFRIISMSRTLPYKIPSMLYLSLYIISIPLYYIYPSILHLSLFPSPFPYLCFYLLLSLIFVSHPPPCPLSLSCPLPLCLISSVMQYRSYSHQPIRY
jgi:hypothetical protein